MRILPIALLVLAATVIRPAFAAQASENGVFLGGGARESYIAVRNRPALATATVRVNGHLVDGKALKVTPSPSDPSIAVVTVGHRKNPCGGAVITVTDGKGRGTRTCRPPDPVQLVNRVSIQRSEKTTTVTVAPLVKTIGPDGKAQVHQGGQSPTGGPPAVLLKDDKGFWEKAAQFLGKVAPGVLIPLATGYLVNASTSRQAGVTSLADGTTSIEMPNQVYDDALNAASRGGGNFSSEDVASSLSTGLSVPGSSKGLEGAKGPVVLSYMVVNGSPTAVSAGSTVIFTVRTGIRQGKVPAVSVLLKEGVRNLGFMTLREVTPAGTDLVIVEAAFSTLPGDTTHIEGVVALDGLQAAPVPFEVAAGSVSLVALQTQVTEGNTVTVVLRAEGGMEIRGTLSLTGPGNFTSNGAKSIPVDAVGSISFCVNTTDPGLIQAEFHPSGPEDGNSGLNQMLDAVGLTMADVALE